MMMLKGYRTVLVNVLAASIPIMELAEWRDVMPDHWLPWYALGMALANVMLRYATTTPIGRKE